MPRMHLKEKLMLVAAVAALVLGAYEFVCGQSLAQLLVPQCRDFRWTANTFTCRQPIVYILVGLGTALTGFAATTAVILRRARRNRRRSG